MQADKNLSMSMPAESYSGSSVSFFFLPSKQPQHQYSTQITKVQKQMENIFLENGQNNNKKKSNNVYRQIQ